MEIKAGDILFLDTCVLLTATVESRQHHQHAQRLLLASGRTGIHFATTGQIMREYLVVATRPLEANGLGLTPPQALTNVAEFRRRLVFFDETELVAHNLTELVRTHQLKGKRIHDANVVATMLAHGITRLVTENIGDFAPFTDITTADSAEAAQAVAAP